MPLIADYLQVGLSLGVKLQITPAAVAMLAVLVFCVAIVWRWAKRRLP